MASHRAVLVAGIALWWFYKQKQKNKQLKAEDFTIPVAKVQHLWLYPMKGSHRLEINQTECLARGFKNDRY